MVPGSGHVSGGQHGDYPRQGLGFGRIYPQHPGVGVAAAQHLAVQHPLKVEVSGKDGLTGGLGPRIRSWEGMPHSQVRNKSCPERSRRIRHSGHGGGRPDFTNLWPLAAGCQDSLDDLGVTRAAAKVPLQGLVDVLPCGPGLRIQEGFGSHDHARRAEATLDGSLRNEGFLQGV